MLASAAFVLAILAVTIATSTTQHNAQRTCKYAIESLGALISFACHETTPTPADIPPLFFGAPQ
jgi:hypothetical protein